MKDVNGQYNFEGFTQLEDYVAAELVKYPHTVGLSFYHEAGVFTIEDKIKWDIYGMISDASKSLNGCRARFDFLQFSVEELYAEYNSYVRMAGNDAEYEAELLASNIKAMIEAGAESEEQAKAWLDQDSEYDYEAEEANLWNEQIQALEDEYLYQLEEAA
jgi:hypothetical protein|tara:strand:- start:556 stop:1035 length:480 start_codon:yes stop_codon:yes gene_type:complete